MDQKNGFQGVVCCCIENDRSVKNTIHKLFDLRSPSSEYASISYSELELKNKYYQAVIQLIDNADLLPKDDKFRSEILSDCHAIILFGNCQKLSAEQLDVKVKELESVGGEPRILLFDGIDTNNSLLDWCIKNGYDCIDAADETASTQLIDSLSAYKWTYRSDNTDDAADGANKPKLNDELMQKLADFDTLLGKLSAYRDRPDLRGDPNDKNIVEIADLLSGLLGDDVDDFLDAAEDTTEDFNDNDKLNSS